MPSQSQLSRWDVQAAIAENLPYGHPTIGCISARLGISSRTLQRRLMELGTSHSALVDAVRCEIACRLLRDTNKLVSDIASDLGFADASSFSRSFRRWMNMEPGVYRKTKCTPL